MVSAIIRNGKVNHGLEFKEWPSHQSGPIILPMRVHDFH